MKYEIIIFPAAKAEIANAYLWIAQRAPENAVTWYNRLLDHLLTLETFPERCPLAPENTTFNHEIRQLFYGRGMNTYRILFDISGRVVRILHVRHGARKRL